MRLPEAERQHEQQGDRHRRAEIGDAVGGTARGQPMAEHDVADEHHAVEQRPGEPDQIARPPDVDQAETCRRPRAPAPADCGRCAGR